MTASRVLAIVLLVPLFALACASRSGPLQSSCPICMCPEPPPPPPPPRRAAPPPPPPPPPPARAPARIVLRGVNFGFDSASIDPASAVVLEVVAQTLKDNSGVGIEVQGYTDSSGPEDYNRGLSQRRAEAVKRFLIGQGVDASRLTARGYGEANPVGDNSTREGRSLNRRVELSQQ